MQDKFGIVFHILTLAHHLYAGKYSTDNLDYSLTNDPEVLKIKQFQFRFFTTWNLIFQMVYFSLAVIDDILKRYQRFEKLDKQVQLIKGYIFTTLVFPGTLYVAIMFWSFFAINRELVLPEAADVVIPSWVNHAVHTNILIVLIIETIIVNQLVPSFKTAFIGLSICTFIYDALVLMTYFQSGRWLYGILYVTNWPERIAFFLFNYLLGIFTMKVGIALENKKCESKEFNYFNFKISLGKKM